MCTKMKHADLKNTYYNLPDFEKAKIVSVRKKNITSLFKTFFISRSLNSLLEYKFIYVCYLLGIKRLNIFMCNLYVINIAFIVN